jgi:glucose/arabinose dehydrogenase
MRVIESFVFVFVGSLVALAGLPALSAVEGRAQQASKPPRRDVSKIYVELCANCHGPNLEGGQGSNLIDDDWKFGGDDASLAKSIRLGHPAQGMPPMGAAVTPQEIRALVIYMREQAEKARRERTTFAKPAADMTIKSELHAFKLETVIDGLTAPWGIDFLPDGRMLVTEKEGKLRIVEHGRPLSDPVADVPAVWSKGQGGLLDVAVHPDYAQNGWIYLSYSDPGEKDSALTAIVRGRLKDDRFVDQETVFKAPAALYRTGTVHFGSRFVFDGKGHIFFSIGERGQQADAQDVTRPNGKVHRINEDGSVPKDNPLVRKPGAFPTIWSYGNRNAQGLARHPDTGELWEVEHGPRGGDELNVIRPGRNYGWPVITYGMNYDGTPMTNLTAKAGMEQPITYWVPSIAVGSIIFYTGDKFPRWKNNLLLGALAQQEVRRLVIEGHKVTHQEALFKGVGRIRDLVVGPEGYVYVAFNMPGGPGQPKTGNDRVARLVPAAAETTSAAR